MSGSVNKVILIGHLGADPEVRTFQNGGKVCSLNLATSETWKDKSTGEKRERTEWHRIAIFNDGLVGIAERFLKKGSKVYVEGKLETRKWQDQSGADRYSTEVALRSFGGTLILLSDRSSGGGDDQRRSSGRDSDLSDELFDPDSHSKPSNGSYGMDDEIPF